jgi:hypothetical protein
MNKMAYYIDVREPGANPLKGIEEQDYIYPTYPCKTRKMTDEEWARYGEVNLKYRRMAYADFGCD